MFKVLAQAVLEVVQMGGRVTEETFDTLEKILGDEFDEFQEFAKEFTEGLEETITKRLATLEKRLDSLTSAPEKKVEAKK